MDERVVFFNGNGSCSKGQVFSSVQGLWKRKGGMGGWFVSYSVELTGFRQGQRDTKMPEGWLAKDTASRQ